MPARYSSESVLISRIRGGEGRAWDELIGRFEGRLLAFVETRLGRRAESEDVVQETLLGFLNSLPNFDESRSLESYLFSIAAHKLTDHLRREGRRPAISLNVAAGGQEHEVAGRMRGASSMFRSGERRAIEEQALAAALGELIERFRDRGEFQRLKCLELLFVRGLANKEAAAMLQISEQAVANFKFDFLARLRNLIRDRAVSIDVFPELSLDT